MKDSQPQEINGVNIDGFNLPVTFSKVKCPEPLCSSNTFESYLDEYTDRLVMICVECGFHQVGNRRKDHDVL